MWYPQI